MTTSPRESLLYARLRRSWHFGRLRPVKCWARLGHVWERYEWTDKHGDLVVEERCVRCAVERHLFALWCSWDGIPVVWRLTYRIKHGEWPHPFWEHRPRYKYHLARVVCAIFGHTSNVHDGGDCRRCWG